MIRVVLTDIEGTTSSLSFVKEVLFPYARAHLAAFVHDNAQDPRVTRQLDAVRREAGDPALSQESVVDRLIAWIDEDRKITPLKALQGMTTTVHAADVSRVSTFVAAMHIRSVNRF